MVSNHQEPRRSASPWRAGWECELAREKLSTPDRFPADAARDRTTSPWTRFPVAASHPRFTQEQKTSKMSSKSPWCRYPGKA